MTRTGHYRVAMTVHDVPPEKLDYPIGSMPPAENLAEVQESPYKLTWTLDNALTSYDIGVKLPIAAQPDYHFARLLREAPVGLVLLLVLIAGVPAVMGRPVRPAHALIAALFYCLHYTFMGHLADVMSGFAGPFLVSAGLLVPSAGWFLLRESGSRLVAGLQAAGFVVAVVLYPLAVVDAEQTALWMQFLWLGVLLLFCVLLRAHPGRTR
jgi:hypothetical protein